MYHMTFCFIKKFIINTFLIYGFANGHRMMLGTWTEPYDVVSLDFLAFFRGNTDKSSFHGNLPPLLREIWT